MRYDFTVAEALNSVGGRFSSFVDRYSIRDFVIRNGYRPTEDDLDAIIRRLDHDGDERINFGELNEAFRAL